MSASRCYLAPMWLTSLAVQGLSALPDASMAHLERVVVRDDSPTELGAWVTALDLLFASLDVRRLRSLLLDLGFAEAPSELEVSGEPLPEQASWPHPDAARALLHPDADRTIRLRATFALDPPQFRTLREEAARRPDLVAGLSGGSTLELQIGWRFASAFRAVQIGLVGAAVGGERIPVGSADRPAWLVPFLADMAHRFRRVGVPGSHRPTRAARLWLAAATSPDPARTAAHRRLAAALAAPPFGLDDPRPVRWNDGRPEVVVGPQGRPVAWEGPVAVAAVHLAVGVYLLDAEILWVTSPGVLARDPAAVRGWLAAEAESAGSRLEQVFLVGGGRIGRGRTRAGRAGGA